MKYVNVAINLPVKNLFKQFTYQLPPELAHVDVGWRVVVPFGAQTVEGFVVALEAAAPAEHACKEVLATMDTRPCSMPKCWRRLYGCPSIICAHRQRRCGFLFPARQASSVRRYTMKAAS